MRLMTFLKRVGMGALALTTGFVVLGIILGLIAELVKVAANLAGATEWNVFDIVFVVVVLVPALLLIMYSIGSEMD